MSELIIYTDGASRGNPGRGGLGVLMMYGSKKKEIAEGYKFTTNNRMELLAVVRALESLKNNQHTVHIFTDSKYVVDAVEKGWLYNWIRTQFAGGKKNKDLWMRYYALSKKFVIRFTWVKGHASNPFNNRCDELATSAADGEDLLRDGIFEQIYASEM